MNRPEPRAISGATSVLLDVLRLGAALTVMYRHALVMWFPDRTYAPTAPGDSAHAAVVVFFVLSGYVIAHTTAGSTRGPLHYAEARLSRLYSVVLPALVVTAVAEAVLIRVAPSLSAEYSRGLPWPRYLLAGSFLNEIWFLSAAPPINRPLWSLGFEFWYYVIFGLWFYRSAGRKGWLLPLAACLVAGPKILAMMPLWVAGVVAYRLPRPRLPLPVAWLLVALGLGGAGALLLHLRPYPFVIGYPPMFYAGPFVSDWATGLLVAAALWLLPTASTAWASAAWVGKFRKLADLTFPLYVLHNPLLVLWRGLFGQRLYDTSEFALALLSVFGASALLGVLLEKQRPLWVSLFRWLLHSQPLKAARGVFAGHPPGPGAVPARVLVYATQHMPTGGIESHLREFCLQVGAAGATVDLVIRHAAMPPDTEALFRRICRRVYLGKTGHSVWRWGWLPITALRLLFRPYAALYTNGQGASILAISRLVPRRSRWVHHHHTAGDEADQATWSPAYWRALHQADVVVACSGRNALAMERALNRPVQSIPCFSHAVSTEALPPGEPLRLGYYGRLIPEKGIDVLCQLSAEPALAGVEFHVWGEGPAYPAGFFARHPRLHFHGAFAGAEALEAVVSSLDAYLLLSTHPEGLPIALLEVMSAGLPWLATDRGGVADIACDPVATRVLPAEATYAEMRAAVVRFAADIRAGRTSRHKQRALYARSFSAEVLVARWQQVLGLDVAEAPAASPLLLAIT